VEGIKVLENEALTLELRLMLYSERTTHEDWEDAANRALSLSKQEIARPLAEAKEQSGGGSHQPCSFGATKPNRWAR